MWILILCLSILTFYVFIIDKENIEIDKYNFEQLEIVDNTIMNDEKYEYSFRKLWQFNKTYNTNIQPIKNCYFISDFNWDEKYIFWFKLESLLYRIKYKSTYIAYPSYQQPESKNIFWFWWSAINDNTDYNFIKFIEHISNPCDEDYL